jgi:hypothetical protein
VVKRANAGNDGDTDGITAAALELGDLIAKIVDDAIDLSDANLQFRASTSPFARATVPPIQQKATMKRTMRNRP